MEHGYFQVYTGEGKGKTTAAVGLAVRAAGAGLRVYIGQFVKSMEYNEVKVLRERFPEITVELYGKQGCIVGRNPDECDMLSSQDGYKIAKEVVLSREYDVVILDEIFIASYFNILRDDQLIDLIESRGEGTELVMTGRYAPQCVLDRADLITEMKNVRHYYEKGVEARDGIER